MGHATGQAGRPHRWLVTLLSLAFVFLTCLFAYIGYLNFANHRVALRQEVRADLQELRVLMAHRTQEDFQTLRHLADALRPMPNALASAQTEGLIRGILQEKPEFKSIALARGAAVEQVWTPQGLSASSGMSIDLDGETQVKLLDNGHLQLDLEVHDAAGPEPIQVHAVLDTGKFIESALSDSLNLPKAAGSTTDFFVTAKTATGSYPIFGNPGVIRYGPEISTLAFDSGSLQIFGHPKAGWRQLPPDFGSFVLALVAADLAFAAPLAGMAVLVLSRARRLRQLRASEDKYQALTRRFQLAMDNSKIGMWELEDSDDRIKLDGRAARLHGSYQRDTLDQSVEDWLASIHPDDRASVVAHIDACRQGEHSHDYRVMIEGGAVRHVRSVGSRLDGAANEGDEAQPLPGSPVIGLVWNITADIAMRDDLRAAKESSDIKNAELELALDELSTREQQLESLSYRFELALDSYGCGIWEHDFVTGRTIWDERMRQLYNVHDLSEGEAGLKLMSHVHDDDRALVIAASREAIEQQTRLNVTVRVLLENGTFRWVRSVGQVHSDRSGQKKLVGVSFDVTADVLMTEELRKAKAEAEARNIELELTKNRVEFNALHDPLTGLANRRQLDVALDGLTVLAQTSRPLFTILHLDLDRFKEINDTLGHAAGDAMLEHVARVLKRRVGIDDLVARIGGDEFVVLLRDYADTGTIAALADAIIRDVNVPVAFEGTVCRCGVSIGIAKARETGTDARKLLINADLALYEAKRQGRNCFEFFTDKLQANILRSKRTADELLNALDNDEITAWYQPQFCANSMELVGAEALVRWQHPVHGVLPSNSFLKVAEDLNVMARIDQIVLEQALKDKMRWAAIGLKIPKISVNVSSRRLHDTGLINTLESLSISPGEISFELVESIFLDESEEIATSNIERIKALGIEIEIDDFGTGHTSIISLLKLQPKRLKIDRQLVMPILESNRERAMVRSIIDIARSLGVATVAEGVESAAHAQILRDLGCDLLQGYAFAKPLPFDEFSRFALDRRQQMAG
ncbi:putative bifunctional diguanylate cyclase/phosphodiesterase [Allorhizobium taibaishanense]|nr:EAL domain-containing protein [Allorhizobium taibaishanense]OLP51843.1 diguanylate cyclase [Allorhizobium taibaishanense]